MSTSESFDWASAALSLVTADSSDIRQLVSAAKLNAEAGDISDIDLSGMDLQGQNLSGWDLRNANFKGANIKNADLTNSSVDPYAIVEAQGWQLAKLDSKLIDDISLASKLTQKISDQELSHRSFGVLKTANVKYIGDLVQLSEGEMLRTPNAGRKSLKELKDLLEGLGLSFGMQLEYWPPKNGALSRSEEIISYDDMLSELVDIVPYESAGSASDEVKSK